jgi:hypothetical protein
MTSGDYTYDRVGELKIYTRIVRSVMCLTEQERLVLLFILDRTIGWHRVWETISEQEFIGGVFRRRGGHKLTVVRGTGLSRSQLRGALVSLQHLDAITLGRLGSRTEYKINEYWCHPDVRQCAMWNVGEGNFEYPLA